MRSRQKRPDFDLTIMTALTPLLILPRLMVFRVVVIGLRVVGRAIGEA